jgi:hypothetical protein
VIALPPFGLRTGLSLAVAVAVASGLAWTGLAALREARADLTQLEAEARLGRLAPAPLLGSGLLHAAPDRAAASAALIAGLRRAAGERRLLVERLAASPPVEGVAAELGADLIVSGPETDILAFVRAVEAGRPAVRFLRWRLARTGPAETAIRLDAHAVGFWEARR